MTGEDYGVRHDALEFAMKSQREGTSPADLVAAAEAYLAFLTNTDTSFTNTDIPF